MASRETEGNGKKRRRSEDREELDSGENDATVSFVMPLPSGLPSSPPRASYQCLYESATLPTTPPRPMEAVPIPFPLLPPQLEDFGPGSSMRPFQNSDLSEEIKAQLKPELLLKDEVTKGLDKYYEPMPLELNRKTDPLHYPCGGVEDDSDEENLENLNFYEEDDNKYSASNSRLPVYKNAPITIHESHVAVLTLALRFSLSGQCIQAILQTIELHCAKEDNVLSSSLYLFKKYFSSIRGEVDYIYYCSKCFSKCDKSIGCEAAGCSKKTPLSCMIKLPLIHQLQILMQREGFTSKLIPLEDRFQSSGISDIYDGKLYKDYAEQMISGKYDLTFMWYTDGAALYKSSKVSVWPMFLSINELPYCERFRKENLLVPVLWCGPVKPHGNILMEAAIPDLLLLRSGVNMNKKGEGNVNVRGFVLAGTGDTPARALMLNMNMHNGEHSCQKCEQQGESREGYPGVRLFPYRPEEMKPREKDTMVRQAQLAMNLRRAYIGIKGPTGLHTVSFDFVRGTAIDAMHLVYGGAAKLNLKMFLDPSSTFSSLPSNASKADRSAIDERLLKIKPPHYITRVPKSINELGSWQTSIHKSMFLYYSLPVLNGFISDLNLRHYASLVAAIQLLNSDCVTTECLSKASALLEKYVRYFQDLYTKNFMSLTIHLLLHLSEVVKELGPLWTTACFPMESVNGEILQLVHGSTYAEIQIASSLQMCLGLEDLVLTLSNSEAKMFCQDLLKKTHSSTSFKFGINEIVGRWEKFTETPDFLKEALETSALDMNKLSIFHRLRRKKSLYVAESYRRSSARDSSSVFYHHDGCGKIGIVKCFLRSSHCTCLECSCDCTLFVVIQYLDLVKSFPTLIPDIDVPNTHGYKRLDSYIILPVDCLHSVCVKMSIHDNLFISKRCNTYENE